MMVQYLLNVLTKTKEDRSRFKEFYLEQMEEGEDHELYHYRRLHLSCYLRKISEII